MELEQTIYALDTTTIDLCLSAFPWARFYHTKAAVKMHEVNVLDILITEASNFYIMDRDFTEFARWFTLHQA